MKLQIYPFENALQFDFNGINVIEIHDFEFFRKLCSSLNTQTKIDNNEEVITLYNEDKKLDFVKEVFTVNSVLDINLNNNNIIKKFYSKIENDLNFHINIKEKIDELYFEILDNFETVLLDYDFDIEYKDELDLKGFFKLISLRINECKPNNIKNNVFSLIDVVSEFNMYKIITFINLKSFFSDEELLEIYKYANYKKQHILVIEVFQNRGKIDLEKKFIIDNEFDDFYI